MDEGDQLFLIKMSLHLFQHHLKGEKWLLGPGIGTAGGQGIVDVGDTGNLCLYRDILYAPPLGYPVPLKRSW